MKNEPLVSVLIPTLNAGNVIEKALISIRKQSLGQEKIEILVIDGGSTDNTIELAKKYNAVILDNPLVVPEAAIQIGNIKAKGRYAVRMGSDEEFTDPNQLERRIQLFSEAPEVKNIVAAQFLTPAGFSGLCHYYNYFGDPFSLFVYRMDGSDMVHSLRKQPVKEYKAGNVYHFEKEDILPIADGATTMLDLQFARENFPDDAEKPEFVSSYLQKMISLTECIGIVPNDTVYHYAKTNLKTIFKKLRFRVVNNVHNVEGSGYAARAVENKKLNKKKYLYPVYCIIFLWPLVDSILLAFKKKNFSMLWNFIFVYYVFGQIIKEYGLKLLHKKTVIKSYAK